MSRGPGKTQVKVLDLLQQYRRLGDLLQWEFSPGTSYLSIAALDEDIESYNRGEIVPMWIILRDTGIEKTALSRAIKGLEKMGYTTRRGADLDLIDKNNRLCLCHNAKHISLTRKGEKLQFTKLTLNT